MERAFHDVKAVFAEYNEWDDYGIALPYKDFDLPVDERLIDFGGTSLPWHGTMTDELERFIMPRCLRSWEGKTVAYSFYMRQCLSRRAWDINFEQEALLRLRGLTLVRLEENREGTTLLQVEGVQSGIAISYPPEACSELSQDEAMIPIMCRFQRFREGASDRYKIVATRFRRAVEHPSSPRGSTTPESGKDGLTQLDALFAHVTAQVCPEKSA